MPVGILNDSDEIRKLLVQQSERYNIPFKHICRRVGIDYDRFIRRYINVKDLIKGGSGLSDVEIVEIGKFLGLDIRTTVVIMDEKTFAQRAVEIKKALKDEYNTKKEGPASEA